MASRAASRTLTEHDEIRQWAEERGATPACVRGTGGDGDTGMIRLDFPGYSGAQSLEPIDWDNWFEKFDESRLALLVQDETAGGERSNFNKLIGRETARAREHGDNRASRRHPERSSGHRSTSRTSASGGSKRRSASSSSSGRRSSGSGSSSSRSAKKGSRSSGNRSARVSGSSSRSKRASSSGSRSKAASSRSRSAGSKRSSSRSRSTASSSRSRGTNSAAKRRTTAAARNRGSKSRSTASTRDRSTRARSSSRSASNRSRTASRGRTSSAASHFLTDHDEIRRWAEEREASPACVRGTGGGEDVGMIRLDFPGYSGAQSLEHIDWDEWFQKFDENNLALLVQEKTARGQQSNFNKLVSRETAEQGGRAASGRKSSSGARAGGSRRRAA